LARGAVAFLVARVPPARDVRARDGRHGRHLGAAALPKAAIEVDRARHAPGLAGRTPLAGPVPGSGPCARRTPPALRVIRFAHAAWRGPGAPAARAQPARPCHPQATVRPPPQRIPLYTKRGA